MDVYCWVSGGRPPGLGFVVVGPGPVVVDVVVGPHEATRDHTPGAVCCSDVVEKLKPSASL
jgi:hypothetical protein